MLPIQLSVAIRVLMNSPNEPEMVIETFDPAGVLGCECSLTAETYREHLPVVVPNIH